MSLQGLFSLPRGLNISLHSDSYGMIVEKSYDDLSWWNTVFIFSVVVSASVLETTKDYSCQEGSQILKLEHANSATDCEQSWTAEGIVRHKCYNFNYHVVVC